MAKRASRRAEKRGNPSTPPDISKEVEEFLGRRSDPDVWDRLGALVDLAWTQGWTLVAGVGPVYERFMTAVKDGGRYELFSAANDGPGGTIEVERYALVWNEPLFRENFGPNSSAVGRIIVFDEEGWQLHLLDSKAAREDALSTLFGSEFDYSTCRADGTPLEPEKLLPWPEKGVGVYPARQCPKCGLIFRDPTVSRKMNQDLERARAS